MVRPCLSPYLKFGLNPSQLFKCVIQSQFIVGGWTHGCQITPQLLESGHSPYRLSLSWFAITEPVTSTKYVGLYTCIYIGLPTVNVILCDGIKYACTLPHKTYVYFLIKEISNSCTTNSACIRAAPGGYTAPKTAHKNTHRHAHSVTVLKTESSLHTNSQFARKEFFWTSRKSISYRTVAEELSESPREIEARLA